MTTTAQQLVDEAARQVDHVTPHEAYREVADGAALLLDVREPPEWERYIAGAIRVPRGVLEFQADPTSPRHLPDLAPSQRLIVFCRSGTRSLLATATLRALGYSRVANLDGGINAWQDAGLAVVETDWEGSVA